MYIAACAAGVEGGLGVVREGSLTTPRRFSIPQRQSGLSKTLLLFQLQGASFADICSLTEAYEGSIIRATRRLDELMGQLQVSHADELSTSSEVIIDITA